VDCEAAEGAKSRGADDAENGDAEAVEGYRIIDVFLSQAN